MTHPYPLEIYPKTLTIIRTYRDLEKAYDLGKIHGHQAHHTLDGYSNLTQAIKSHQRIAWSQLNQRSAKCVHPQLGILNHRLERNTKGTQKTANGWFTYIKDGGLKGWTSVFADAWYGHNDWTLWIEGDIPLTS